MNLNKIISSIDWSKNGIKYGSLMVLTVQTASHALYIRYISTGNRVPIIKTVCVFIQEMVKLITSFIIVCIQEKSLIRGFKQIYSEMFGKWKDTLKVFVPAIIYVIQNNLAFLAAEHLESPVYLVSYQLKILTTAFFTVIILKRRISLLQWIALVLLFLGVGLVEWEQKEFNDSVKGTKQKNTKKSGNILVGFVAVIIACILSGFAGIYWEKLLKHKSDVSIWLRNAELAFVSLPITVVTIIVNDGNDVKKRGLMAGIDQAVWITMLISSFGGLLVGIVIKFANNILKAFATSFSIILACIVSIFLFNFFPKIKFISGATLVIGAIFLYSLFPYKAKEESDKDDRSAEEGEVIEEDEKIQKEVDEVEIGKELETKKESKKLYEGEEIEEIVKGE